MHLCAQSSIGDMLEFSVFTSHYGMGDIENACLSVSLSVDGNIKKHKTTITNIANGQVSKLDTVSLTLSDIQKPVKMTLYATLEGEEVFAENEWELYLFPKLLQINLKKLIIKDNINADELCSLLEEGNDVLLFGNMPFETLPTSFRISLAGRTFGNLATVVNNHFAIADMPNDGFCGWQFAEMLDGGRAV